MAEAALRWGIIGGGILGMRLAGRLAERGGHVVLIESGPVPGGLAGAWTIGCVTWDKHYHVILRSDEHALGLLQELNLRAEIRWSQVRTGLYAGGRLHSLSSRLDFLRFPFLNAPGKLRLAATILRAAHIRDGRALEAIPASAWLIRWSGRATFERIWLPLLRAKLGEGYRAASAALVWAMIARMYAARRTARKREEFGFVPGGYARILGRFEKRLRELGVELHLNRTVRLVRRTASHLVAECDDGSCLEFDRVVVTIPAPEAARICSGLTAEEHALLKETRYQGIVCASLLSRAPLSDFYLTYILDSGSPFGAIVEMSALTGREFFDGNCLIYLPKYVAPEDPVFGLTDEQIAAQFLPALERMYPRFRQSDVVAFRVSRVRHVFAIPVLDYSRRVAPLATSVPGLFLINSAHILDGTLNVNQTLALAERVLPLLEG